MEFGYPGISPSEIKRRRLKRQAQDFAGGDPFCNEREDGLLSKRRKIESFPIGPPKDVCVLNHRGLHRKVVPTQHQKKTADSSPGTAKAKRNIEGKKSKQLITADESTTIGRLELFALHTDYTQTSTTRAAPRKNKKNRKNVPKKTRRDTASHLIFGKGIAGVGVWLGKSGTTTNPASDLGRQFSGDSLLDGILGTPQQTLPKKSVAIRRHPRVLPSRSPGSLPKTPIDGDFPQTPTIVTLCDDTASNGTVEGEFYKLCVCFLNPRAIFLTRHNSENAELRLQRTHNPDSATPTREAGTRRRGLGRTWHAYDAYNPTDP